MPYCTQANILLHLDAVDLGELTDKLRSLGVLR